MGLNPASLAGDVLTNVPEPLATTLVVGIPLAAGTLAHYVFDGRFQLMLIERKAARVLNRQRRDRAEVARQDVQTRARSFAAWDAEVDRVWPTQVIAIPTDLMDHDGLGAL